MTKPDGTDDSIEPSKPNLFAWLRGRFLAGVVIAAPIVITLYVVISLFSWMDKPFQDLIRRFVPESFHPSTYLPDQVTLLGVTIDTPGLPGLGLFVAVILLTLVGAVGTNLIGRSMVRAGDRLLSRLPVVSNVYSLFKQLFETIVSSKENSFKDMVLIEYPKKGTWCIGFVTAPIKGEVKAKLGDGMMGVFVPTTPNPTSGFYMFVPKAEVIDLDMSVEDGAKMIVSVGMVVPEYLSDEQVAGIIDTIPPAETETNSK
ncbi:MAG: DUF502 domain-containing protein [Hyphomonadaceae bacterium]